MEWHFQSNASGYGSAKFGSWPLAQRLKSQLSLWHRPPELAVCTSDPTLRWSRSIFFLQAESLANFQKVPLFQSSKALFFKQWRCDSTFFTLLFYETTNKNVTLAAVSFFNCSSKVIFISWRLSSCWDFSLNVDSNCEKGKSWNTQKLPTGHSTSAWRSLQPGEMHPSSHPPRPWILAMLGMLFLPFDICGSSIDSSRPTLSLIKHLLGTSYVLRPGDGKIRRDRHVS